MKTILTSIAIALATITIAKAQDTEAHCFKAAELEIEAEVLSSEISTRLENVPISAYGHHPDIPAIADSVRKVRRLEARAEAHRRKCKPASPSRNHP